MNQNDNLIKLVKLSESQTIKTILNRLTISSKFESNHMLNENLRICRHLVDRK